MSELTGAEKAALPYRPCVGLCVMNRDGLIFAARRNDRRASEEHAWQMPQGGIDKGEAPEVAALRELVEETSISPDRVEILAETADWVRYDLPDDLIGHVWKGRYRGQEMKWYLLRYLGTDDEIDIATDHPEFTDWAWKPAEDLPANIVPFKRAVYERVLAEFAGQIGPA
ncbi:RNA pyrophosphohydrolase [Paracoccaceae bacterium GXU_MW_L88]